MTTAERMANESYKPWSGADVETIQAFLNDLAIVQTEFPGFHMSAFNFWGKSQTEMREIAAAQNASNKKRAGVKALKAKYGPDGAAHIVRKHSGRGIR